MCTAVISMTWRTENIFVQHNSDTRKLKVLYRGIQITQF